MIILQYLAAGLAQSSGELFCCQFSACFSPPTSHHITLCWLALLLSPVTALALLPQFLAPASQRPLSRLRPGLSCPQAQAAFLPRLWGLQRLGQGRTEPSCDGALRPSLVVRADSRPLHACVFPFCCHYITALQSQSHTSIAF